MKRYRIEERYFMDGTSEFYPQYYNTETGIWNYCFRIIKEGTVTLIKFNNFKDAIDAVNLDKQGLSQNPLTITYHEILDIPNSVKNV